MLSFIQNIKNLSVKKHLIIGVTLVHAVLMCGFVFDRVEQEKQLLNHQINETARSLSQSLAISSSSWVIARDIAGLDELVQANKSFSNLIYAFIITPEGKVLAHSDPHHIGEFINDLKSLELLKSKTQISQINTDAKMVDYAAPILVHNKLIGWARVALNRNQISNKIKDVIINGIAYSLFAILLGGMMAWGISKLLTNQLEALAQVADSIRKGNHEMRAQENSTNEVGRLAGGFNEMVTSLNESNKKLIQSAKMASLGEMAAGIAHEINNPLAIIIGKTERLMQQNEPYTLEQTKNEFAKLNLTAKRIAKIINGLRNFSRTADHDPLELVNFENIISEALALCGDRLKNHNIKVHLDLPSQVNIKCKPVQISQVFINLINNATDAIIKQNEKWIRITGKMTDTQKIIITFTDSGPGIPKNIADKIMQPFYTTKEVGKGTGLGLSISKGIIEDHGGHIFLDLQNKNTCFQIELPIDHN